MKIEIPEQRTDAHQWLLQFKEVKENWLEEVKGERTGSERTCLAYLDLFIPFVRYMDMTPAEIIAKGAEEQRKEQTSELERKTWADRTALAFFNWLQTQPTKKGELWTRSSAKSAYGAIRSFLRYNGLTFKGKTPIAQTQTTTKLPSNEQMAQAWKMSTPDHKLPTAIHRSTMWRPEDVLALTYGDLQEQYDPKRFYIEKVTQKEELRVGVYLTAETTELLRLHIRQKYGDKKPKASERILPYDYANLRYHVREFGKAAGLEISPKTFRKLGRTRCAPVIGQDAVFKMAGWALPGVGRNYVLPAPEDTLKCYLQIEALLTFEPQAVTDKEQARQNLVNFAIAQGIPPETAKQMAAIWREKAMEPEEAALEVRKAVEQVKAKETATNGCANGLHCQRIAAEDELPSLLVQGWHVAAVLPSGKIVVSNV